MWTSMETNKFMETKKLITYLTCEKFVNNIYQIVEQRYKASLHKDAIVINIDDDKNIVLFKFGAIVCWNIGYEDIKFFLDFVKNHQIESFKEYFIEELEYEEQNNFKIKFDTLSLDNSSILAKIAISHALAQNVKLEQFEKQVQNSIEENSKIPLQLSIKGKIDLKKQDISKKIGELFLVKSKINLHYDLLDTPEFIWEYPEYELYYESMTRYLDIKARVEVLNKKVEVVQELLNMLVNEQHHKYSSFLEWIIIVLIGVEIVMSLIDRF